MATAVVTCQRCQAPLDASVVNAGEMRCAACGGRLQAAVFPALMKPVQLGRAGDALLVDGQSSCFYHAEKAATVSCETCGRFLCALCDIEFGGKHVCPACLESGNVKDDILRIENRRFLPNVLALDLSIVPIIVCSPIVIFTAPIVLYLCVRYWGTPLSLVSPGRWQFVFAFLISMLELGLVVVLIGVMIVTVMNS